LYLSINAFSCGDVPAKTDNVIVTNNAQTRLRSLKEVFMAQPYSVEFSRGKPIHSRKIFADLSSAGYCSLPSEI
jgi:hypothetical protein